MSRKKLLLADDSVTIQKVVTLTFADEGIDVITVGDGEAATAVIRERKPDIVLADVNMPGPDGYRICELIRASAETRYLPVILLVGSFEPFDEEAAARVGASAYLTKPFQSIRQLVEIVHELIAESELRSAALATEQVSAKEDSVAFNAVPSFSPSNEAGDLPVENGEEDIESLYRQSISENDHDDFAETFEEFGIDDPTIEMEYAESRRAVTGEEPFDEISVYSDLGSRAGIAEPQVSEEDENFFQTLETPRDVDQHPPDEPTQPAETDYSGDASSVSISSVQAPDDLNLLELPPVGVESVTTITPNVAPPMSSQTLRLVISVSPELVEAIANRVIEKLREKD
ncbi:MAG: hypothetical protein C4325_05495 [Blastocatellia bacterium]